jgi:lipoprotein-anchoring transpeptidase ErfK/SrfK
VARRPLTGEVSGRARHGPTPTPRGLYYIVELLQPRRADGSYGPFSFGLSAHSNVLKRFAGGDGRVGLHGTNQPGLIGSDVSHGCIRLRNEAVRRLAKILPLGTPVYIRA